MRMGGEPKMRETWSETEATFARLFGDELVTPDPGVLPQGQNIMTPDVLGYIIRGGIVVEISAGTGMSNDRIIGVTFCEWDDAGNWAASDRSRCCFSWDEVVEVLTG